MHESASGVSFWEVDWFASNDVLVDAIEVPKVGWRTKDEPLEYGLVKDEYVAPGNDVCVNVVRPDLA